MLMAVVGVLAVLLAATRFGRRLARAVPLWALVAVQAFRLPLELAMHAMAERGVMPEQMSYTGRNFDILTGVTALVVAPLVARGVGGRKLVAAWNVLGLGLLLNVVVVAVRSTPMFRAFGDDALNTWVADSAVRVVAGGAGPGRLRRTPGCLPGAGGTAGVMSHGASEADVAHPQTAWVGSRTGSGVE